MVGVLMVQRSNRTQARKEVTSAGTQNALRPIVEGAEGEVRRRMGVRMGKPANDKRRR